MMASKPKAKFHWSDYWNSWSLVLADTCQAKPGYGGMVEIDLTGPDYEYSRQILRALNVRRHCTMRTHRDHSVDHLPLQWREQVENVFGYEVASFLLDTDPAEILAMIDFEKHAQLSNGGASLYDIVKDEYTTLLPAPMIGRMAA